MFEIWKKFSKSFPTHRHRSRKNSFLIKFSKQKWSKHSWGLCSPFPPSFFEPEVPALSCFHTCVHLCESQSPALMILALIETRQTWGEAEMVAQGGEMTCPRSCTGAVTQVVSNNFQQHICSWKGFKETIHCPALLLLWGITWRSYRVLCQAKGFSKSWPWFSWEGRRVGMDTRVLNYRSWIKEGDSSNKHLSAYFRGDGCIPHLPEWSEDEEELTGWTKYYFLLCQNFYFHWGPGPVSCSHTALGSHNAPSSSSWVAHHPAHTAKQAENCVVPAALLSTWLASRRGNMAASPCCKQMAQKEKKGKKKVPTGRVCCFHRTGGSKARLDYNPCYVFISALFTRCCSPWLSFLVYCSKVHHHFTRKTLPPCKANPWKWRSGDWISMLISNYKAQEPLSKHYFWFCFLFLPSCSQSFASEKCYKQPWPRWKKQYAVSLTSTSLFRSLSALWLMVLFINVGRLSAFPE